PVHPVPLYEMLGCIFIIFVLVMIQKKVFVSGSRFLVLVVLYGAVRFATEFFRAESFAGETQVGINMVQTVILIVVPLLVAWIFWREKKASFATASVKTSAVEKTADDIPSLNWLSVIYFLFISALFLITSRWLSMLEVTTLNL